MVSQEEERGSWIIPFATTLILVFLATHELVEKLMSDRGNIDMAAFETIVKIFSGY